MKITTLYLSAVLSLAFTPAIAAGQQQADLAAQLAQAKADLAKAMAQIKAIEAAQKPAKPTRSAGKTAAKKSKAGNTPTVLAAKANAGTDLAAAAPAAPALPAGRVYTEAQLEAVEASAYDDPTPLPVVTVSAKPRIDPMRVKVVMRFPPNVKTIQQATQYMLETVDYKLTLNPLSPEETKRILSRPLLPQDRDGSLKSIQDGLLQIAGDDTILIIDRENKLISFEVDKKKSAQSLAR